MNNSTSSMSDKNNNIFMQNDKTKPLPNANNTAKCLKFEQIFTNDNSSRSDSSSLETIITYNEAQSILGAGGHDADNRGQWTSSFEFLLSCISMSVGLGNVWRFPYVAYKNGGGAFLIPYLLLLFVIGRPIYYFELVLGQFSGRGPVKIWKAVPAFKGVGVAQLFSVSYVTIFYNYLMAISVYYFFASFSFTLPWTECDNSWVTEIDNFCHNNLNSSTYQNKSWPELYYEKTVLNQSTGLLDLNSVSWKLVFCLVLSWILVYASIVKGVSSLGKVAYFTAIFPYFVLITLLIVSLFQDGAVEGIVYFITPQFERLLDPIVWYAAVEQSFFSLAVCFGSLIMFSSYNNFNNNVKRDAVIISVLDTFTSLLAGFVIFAVLGAMAKDNGVSIDSVVTKGTGLAFIVYPEGLSKIKWLPQLWSILFFVMLFTLGIGSSVAMIETILTCVKDHFTGLQRHKGKTAAAACFIFMCLGLPLTTDAGPYIMGLLDNYGVGTAAFLYGILEMVGFTWIYGLQNLCDDIHFMLKSKVNIFWRLTWGYITPLTLIVIFFYGNILMICSPSSSPTEMTKDVQWSLAIGWFLAMIALIQIPLWAFIVIAQSKGITFIEKLKASFSPANDWGPIKDQDYKEWVLYKIERSFANNKQSIQNNVETKSFSHGVIIRNGQDNHGFVKDYKKHKQDHC